MTERLLLVATIAVLTYATRYAGFALGRLGGRTLPPTVERFLAYVPIAAFAALVAPGVADGSGSFSARVAAIAAAAAVALWSKRMWAALLVGMACYWVTDLLLG